MGGATPLSAQGIKGLPEFVGEGEDPGWEPLLHPYTFISVACPCIVDYVWRFRFQPETIARLSPARLQVLASQEKFDLKERVAVKIREQCPAHAHIKGVKALYEELWHLHGKGFDYACGCAVALWHDDREDLATHPLKVVEHWLHTKRCAKHAHLADPAEHMATAQADAIATKDASA